MFRKPRHLVAASVIVAGFAVALSTAAHAWQANHIIAPNNYTPIPGPYATGVIANPYAGGGVPGRPYAGGGVPGNPHAGGGVPGSPYFGGGVPGNPFAGGGVPGWAVTGSGRIR